MACYPRSVEVSENIGESMDIEVYGSLVRPSCRHSKFTPCTYLSPTLNGGSVSTSPRVLIQLPSTSWVMIQVTYTVLHTHTSVCSVFLQLHRCSNYDRICQIRKTYTPYCTGNRRVPKTVGSTPVVIVIDLYKKLFHLFTFPTF